MTLVKFAEEARPITVPVPPPIRVAWTVAWPNPVPDPSALLTVGMKDTASRLEVAVAKLAEFAHADQVAAFLANQGVKGSRGDAHNCAIARWLQKVVGDARISVGNGICLNYDHGVMGVMQTPPVLRAFYHKFDEGFYPDLVAR